jgi:type IV secretory pathway VirB10-like protein
MKSMLHAGIVAGIAVLGGSPSWAQSQSSNPSIIDDPKIRQLQDQDIDANQALVDALRRAATRGAIFRLSPESVNITLETNETRNTTVRITNTGDQPGAISGINLLGSFRGLSLEDTCPVELLDGDFCEINLTYEAGSRPTQLQTTVVGTIEQRRETESLDIPVNIEVNSPPPEPEPEPAPEPVARPEPEQSSTPLPRDIARGYFGALGPALGSGMQTSRGFTIVSADQDPSETENIAGVRYDDIRVETITSDERYDPEAVPYTEASLPVNRDKILTSDRVIKAVLETPVSNVMCNKVVAMVESDVYSATSDRPLIQAGSRVIGECQEFAGERAGIAWSRILTTDGRSISFQNLEADTNDATGLGGAVGRVYMSPFDKYVLPIFSTMIDTAAGVIFATFGEDEEVITDEGGNISQGRSAENEGLRIVTGEARETAQQLIRDIRDVREVVVVPKGSRIDIEIMEDIYFKDNREVVRLADLQFDLEGIEDGAASRDLPDNLALTPARPGYEGPTVMVGGRAYRVTESSTGGGEADPAPQSPRDASGSSQDTLNDLARSPKTQPQGG